MWMTGSKDREKKELLDLWSRLAADQQQMLLRFARFLVQEPSEGGCAGPIEPPDRPLDLPRPARESAVAGLKRLKKNYPMIEADEKVLSEASRILMGKVMGVPDATVIDQLEGYFADCYQQWQAARVAIQDQRGDLGAREVEGSGGGG